MGHFASLLENFLPLLFSQGVFGLSEHFEAMLLGHFFRSFVGLGVVRMLNRFKGFFLGFAFLVCEAIEVEQVIDLLDFFCVVVLKEKVIVLVEVPDLGLGSDVVDVCSENALVFRGKEVSLLGFFSFTELLLEGGLAAVLVGLWWCWLDRIFFGFFFGDLEL